VPFNFQSSRAYLSRAGSFRGSRGNLRRAAALRRRVIESNWPVSMGLKCWRRLYESKEEPSAARAYKERWNSIPAIKNWNRDLPEHTNANRVLDQIESGVHSSALDSPPEGHTSPRPLLLVAQRQAEG